MIYNELLQRGTADFPIGYYYIDKNHTRYEMTAHWHNEVELIRILEGSLKVRLNNHVYLAKPGDVFFVNSETIHSAQPDNCTYECMVFGIDFLNSDTYSCRFFIESIVNREYMIKEYSSTDDTEFNDSVHMIFESIKNKTSGYKFLVIGALYRMLGIIVDKHLYSPVNGNAGISDDKNIPKLKKVLTFMRDNYDKQISLEDIATAAGMSPKYFCYFFKERTGKTPFEYLNGYRIERASQKLLSTDLNVTEIAFSCGFNDLSYFIKTFKSFKNISPAKFRKE